MQLTNLPIQQAIALLRKYWLHLLIFLITITGSWFLWAPKPTPPEIYSPAVIQADGSLMLERKPDAAAKPETVIPKGARLERKVTIKIQGKTPLTTVSGSVTIEQVMVAAKSLPPEEVAQVMQEVACPPVTVDLSLVKMPDETRRVIASSPDGVILGGVDIPVESAKPQPEPKNWSAGLMGDPFRQTLGIFVDRRFGWLTVGGEVMQREIKRLPEQFNLRVGVNF